MSELASKLLWPLSRLGEGFELLLATTSLSQRLVRLPNPDARLPIVPEEMFRAWLVRTADQLQLETLEVETTYRELEDFLRRSPPALLRVAHPDGLAFVLLARTSRGKAVVIDVLGIRRTLPLRGLAGLLTAKLEERHKPVVDRMMESVTGSERRRARVRRVLMTERLGVVRVVRAILLRDTVRSAWWGLVHRSPVPLRLASFLTAHAAEYALLLLSWFTIGRALLEDRLTAGAVVTWGLLLLTTVPVRMLVTDLGGRLMLEAGLLFKRRILEGGLRLLTDEIRTQGAGQMLGRVMEANLIETLAQSGGVLALTTVIELAGLLFIIARGAAPLTQFLALVLTLALAALLGKRLYVALGSLSDTRLELTHETVEQMVGHRTRLIEERPDRWHTREDDLLDRYLASMKTADCRAARLLMLIPRGWLIVAIVALTPFILDANGSFDTTAISVGAAFLGMRVFAQGTSSAVHLVLAAVAWKRIGPIFRAATRDAQAPTCELWQEDLPMDRPRVKSTSAVVLQAHDLVFRYRELGRPLLNGASLTVRDGDRILLEGPSGGGKSTFLSLLMGFRDPQSGLLLLEGWDRHAIGLERWRQKVVAAPQFHENRIFAESLAFNLLLGRAWPPSPDDLRAARNICAELGLGPLLKRMPSGMDQLVGEIGWQLSHGEQSRIFIARALLQSARMMVLDESFGALDPETMRRALRCVLDRAPALIVIAHP
ncbi:hypothetical protein D187_010332 [Cystobacter fuscus DSM 2262]|uniref:ABC transporter domain-containing protein n=1 Tax=Cystobacter fuscus (strain ATCC 25194 / DSM 2262 / NBRC 100088 / M29) TaxID=1242864 RepID=S9QYG7_CYSF2|nr:ATP-binding cassette domain-containing protein [Cystobacter fuscus]EPX61713.1 hypothetical protein D187_010332 [Cystobacter fuscus DSM 2262]